MKRAFDRRSLLRAATATSCLAALRGTAWARALPGPRVLAAGPQDQAGGPVLVLLQLTGGNDGLSTVVPHGDDLYHESRRATRIDAADVLAIDEHVGFHPQLSDLKELFDEGLLAVVQGCGYPEPNRSHFKSMEIWHAANLRGRLTGDGWVGRACNLAFGEESRADRMIHIGGKVPFSLASRVHGASSFLVPEGYRWIDREEDVAKYDERVAKEGSTKSRLKFLRGVLSDARQSSLAIRQAAASYQPSFKYPNDPLAFDLMAAAALINSDIGARVLSVELDGFDTHSNQRGKHGNLMQRLGTALSAFTRDLSTTSAGRGVVVVVFSEFGRRVEENGSGGTDHGAAGPMFVTGARVRGGLHGDHPSLEDLDDGDLKHTTDFRSVYSAAITDCFGVDPAEVLGEEYPRLDLIA